MRINKLIIKALAILAIPAMSQETAEQNQAEISSEQVVEAQAKIVSVKITPDASKKALDIIVTSDTPLDDPTMTIVDIEYPVILVSETSDVIYKVDRPFTFSATHTMVLKAGNLPAYNIGVIVSKKSDGTFYDLKPGQIASTAKQAVDGTPSVEQTTLDRDTIFNGADWIDPNTLAKARAKYMADNEFFEHIGSAASLRTNRGILAEGIGKGWGSSALPETCTAKNGTAAIGDGWAQSASGTIYRVRLYNSPSGTTDGKIGNGLIGGGRVFGGRRRR
jgi:hypothetical protein